MYPGPLGASLWLPEAPKPKIARHHWSTWTEAHTIKYWREGYASVISSRYKGKDHSYAPELLGEYHLDRLTVLTLRWALLDAAERAYVETLREVR